METGDVVFTIVRVCACRVRHCAVFEVPGNPVFVVLAIVENAIFKSASSGEEVYGLVNLSLNALNDLSADIRLSSKAGKGVHYHEAWHYVNLLMHDANERAILYKEYEDLHPELKGKMYKDIEEAMAEDFRAYMEMRTSYAPSSIINRLWDDIKTLIGVANNKSAYRY